MKTRLTHKRMTPPWTQNLKTLGLWVLFLICCSTFSFLSNEGLKLTLEYLTIDSHLIPNNLFQVRVFPSHWYIPSWAKAKDPLLVLLFTHLYETHLPKTSIRKTFHTNWAHSPGNKDEPSALIPLIGKIQGKIPWRSKTMRNESTHVRKWHHLQPKTLRH